MGHSQKAVNLFYLFVAIKEKHATMYLSAGHLNEFYDKLT
jgi:hypothetical protein